MIDSKATMIKVISRIIILSLLLDSFADANNSIPMTVTATPLESHHVYSSRCEDYVQAGLSLNLRDVGLQRVDSNFTKSPHIVSLNFENNDIAYVSPSSFSSLPNLRYLNLATNHLSLVNFSRLDSHDRLCTLVLDENVSDESSIILNFTNTFSSLTHLYLRNCSIADITSLSFAPKLVYLNLSANYLGNFALTFLNDIPVTLRALDLSNNGIEKLKTSRLSSIEILRLDGNKFERLCGKSYCSEAVLGLEGATNLQWFSASGNALTTVDSDAFDESVNIIHLDLSRNKIDSIQKGTFEKLEELKYLSLENNMLKTIPELCNLESLRHLYLAKNYLSVVSNDSFCQIENLTYVELSNNRIEFVEAGALDKLTSLKVLKLSNNLIATFLNSWLEHLMDLRELYVDGNRLKSLSDIGLGGVSMFAKLKSVYAQNNLIHKLYTGSLHSEVRNRPNITIQLFDFDDSKDKTQKVVSREEACKCDCNSINNDVFF